MFINRLFLFFVMSQNIEDRVKEALEENGFKLNYDPRESKYNPWYNMEMIN